MRGHSPERDIYEKLWRQTVEAFDSGNPGIDPFLKNRGADKRRGITLLARPDLETRERIEIFLREIACVAPEQYFYQPKEFHLTVLSIIPGSESWQQSVQRLPDYLVALDKVLKNRPSFSVTFRGVTASPEAVMIQGFPDDNSLTQLRDDLRAKLIQHGLGEKLDSRYKIVTAHLTVMRFSTPMTDWKPLKKFLAANRSIEFGVTRFHSLQLVESDWYLSDATARVLREFPLA